MTCSESKTIEQELADIQGDPSTEAEFGKLLDQLQSGDGVCDPDPDREDVAEGIVTSWKGSTLDISLLEFTRRSASVCTNKN